MYLKELLFKSKFSNKICKERTFYPHSYPHAPVDNVDKCKKTSILHYQDVDNHVKKTFLQRSYLRVDLHAAIAAPSDDEKGALSGSGSFAHIRSPSIPRLAHSLTRELRQTSG